MFIYVPERVAANPPILALIHYCGGTASAVFGQAQGGGIVSAADQYGFIIVAPSSGRCWDVQSNKAWTRDGGGDSHAIRQMVRYAVDNRNGNPDRVYATGDSSGGMMTELLLALYPDVFKGGAAFAGMPAACRGTNESGSGGGYSSACAGGSVTHTAQQWGDIARMLAPGYAGHRPRVQLFHGDADTTIRYANHTEAIKEWTNVLGLSTAPTTTDTGVALGSHQATRQRWQNACGQVVLDAFTSIGGDHGPSDALFKSQFVIPFLGLDKTGAVDPEVQQCGAGGAGGSAGGGGGAGGTAAARAAAPALEPGAPREEVARVEPSAEVATAAVVPAGAAAMAAPPATAGPVAPLVRRDKRALREAAATAVPPQPAGALVAPTADPGLGVPAAARVRAEAPAPAARRAAAVPVAARRTTSILDPAGAVVRSAMPVPTRLSTSLLSPWDWRWRVWPALVGVTPGEQGYSLPQF